MRSDLPHPVDERPPPLARNEPGAAPWLHLSIALKAAAPRTARDQVAHALAGRVSALIVEQAKLVASELVTNSLVHSGAGKRAKVTVTLRESPSGCRIEVQDPGLRSAEIQPRSPDKVSGGGMGLIIIDRISAQWGVLSDEDGSSRVWAELIDGDVAETR